jgi:hypothetical protein
MSQGYQNPNEDAPEDEDPKLAIRRHTDRCFFKVEEIVEGEGYIVEGILIPLDDVAEVRESDDNCNCNSL